MFAIHAGIAIDNARLHDQVQRLAVVEERERIGKDLHDGIIQSIYGVGLSLEEVPSWSRTRRPWGGHRAGRPRDRFAQPRHLRHPLVHPPAPAGACRRGGPGRGARAVHRGAGHATRRRPRRGSRRRCRLLRSMPPDRRSDVLFIAREALSNVARHAGATQTVLVLRADGEDLVLTIEDNGRGFDPEALDGPDGFGQHQGIVNMRARAEGMGGTFEAQRPATRARVSSSGCPCPSAAASGARSASATGDPPEPHPVRCACSSSTTTRSSARASWRCSTVATGSRSSPRPAPWPKPSSRPAASSRTSS